MINEEMLACLHAGETDALTAILENNKGLVHKMVFRYRHALEHDPALSQEDITQAAYLGLIEAAYAWEPAHGAFGALAWLHIRKAIYGTLGNRYGAGRGSVHASLTGMEESLQDEISPGPEAALLSQEVNRAMEDAHRALGNPPLNRATRARLRESSVLRGLWEEYTGAAWDKKGLKSWRATQQSATEAAVLRRERLRALLGEAYANSSSNSGRLASTR